MQIHCFCLQQVREDTLYFVSVVRTLRVCDSHLSHDPRWRALVSVRLIEPRHRQPQTDEGLRLSDSQTQRHDCGLPHRLSHPQHPSRHGHVVYV